MDTLIARTNTALHLRMTHRSRERSALLDRLLLAVRSQPYVAAAWIYGSIGRGDHDCLSDIDIRVVFRCEPKTPHWYSLYTTLHPLLVVEAPQNRPAGGAFQTCWHQGDDGPHAVDWTWQPAAGVAIPAGVALVCNPIGLENGTAPMEFAYQPVPERDHIEQITQGMNGFWSMLLVVAKCAARNPYDSRMELLRWTVPQLREAQAFAGLNPVPEFDDMPDHVSPATKLCVLRELARAAESAAPALREHGVVFPGAIVAPTLRYLALIEAIIGARRRD